MPRCDSISMTVSTWWTLESIVQCSAQAAISRQLRTLRSNVTFSRYLRTMSPPMSCLCWTLSANYALKRSNVSFFSRVVKQMSPPIYFLSLLNTDSLFHQILGVAFFQFVRSLFKTISQNVSRIIFYPPLTSLKIWCNFVVYFGS